MEEKPEIEEDEDVVEFEGFTKNKEVREIIKQEVLTGNKRRTAGNFTLTELVKVVCMRADAIDSGAKAYVSTDRTRSCDIALEEIKQGKCPFSIMRTLRAGKKKEYVEIWQSNELRLLERSITHISSILNSEIEMVPVKKSLEKFLTTQQQPEWKYNIDF